MATRNANIHSTWQCFAFISSTGERVYIDVSEPAVVRQSAWLEAATNLGEDEGIVPVANTAALRCLVAYMQHHATSRDGREAALPLVCSCGADSGGPAYDVERVLAPSDVMFLDAHMGPAADGTWALDAQEMLLDLIVTADFIGHGHLRDVCVAYLGCRIMSAAEADTLRWFGLRGMGERSLAEASEEGHGTERGEKDPRLGDDERLHILKAMKKYINVDDVDE